MKNRATEAARGRLNRLVNNVRNLLLYIMNIVFLHCLKLELKKQNFFQMEFCPTCGNLLRYGPSQFFCSTCPYIARIERQVLFIILFFLINRKKKQLFCLVVKKFYIALVNRLR